MPDDRIPISDLDEALELSDAAQFPYTQNNGGTLTTYKALLTQIAAKIIEDMTFAGIDLPVSAGVKSVENTLNYLINSVGGDPNGNISDSYDPTAAYVKGDLCIYENVLYICTAPTTGTFDPSNWTATTIDSVIGSLSTLTTTDKSSIVGAVNEVVDDIDDLQTNKSNTLMVSTTALSINYGGARYKSQSFDVTRAGYTVLGVAGYSLSSIDNIVFSCRITSTNTLTVGIQTRDGSNSSATISGYADILYVKNS